MNKNTGKHINSKPHTGKQINSKPRQKPTKEPSKDPPPATPDVRTFKKEIQRKFF